jgi:hypothetical protein
VGQRTMGREKKSSLRSRLAEQAKKLKEAAKLLRPGQEHEAMLRKASQLEVASHVDAWLGSPGLQPPK